MGGRGPRPTALLPPREPQPPEPAPGRRSIRLYRDAGAVLEDFLRRASPRAVEQLRRAGLEL